MGAGPLVWGREGPPDGLAIGHSLRHYTRRRRACFVPCLFALLRRKKSDALWILVLSDETCLGVIMFVGCAVGVASLDCIDGCIHLLSSLQFLCGAKCSQRCSEHFVIRGVRPLGPVLLNRST